MKLKDALIVVALVCLAVVPVAVSYYPGLYTTWWVDGGAEFSNGGSINVSAGNLVETANGSTVTVGDAGNFSNVNTGGYYSRQVNGVELVRETSTYVKVNALTEYWFGDAGVAVAIMDPLGNLTLDGGATVAGTLSSATAIVSLGPITGDAGINVQGHIDFTGPKPTIATSRTAPLTGCFDAGAPTLSANSTDSAGVVSLTTGSLAAGGCAGTQDIGDITFTGALSATRVACVVTPDITNTGAGSTIGILPTVALGAIGFSIYTSGITQTPAPSTTYSWDYACFALH